MSQASIVELLRQEEGSLQNQLSAIQRAIEAIELADTTPTVTSRAVATAARKRTVAPGKPERQPRRALSAEQRQATSERMKKYWAGRRAQKASGEAVAVQAAPAAPPPSDAGASSAPEGAASEA